MSMSSDLRNLLAHPQLPPNYQPQVVQINFDGVRVLRIEGGVETYHQLNCRDIEPKSIEMIWDGQVVLELQGQQVTVNRLMLLVASEK